MTKDEIKKIIEVNLKEIIDEYKGKDLYETFEYDMILFSNFCHNIFKNEANILQVSGFYPHHACPENNMVVVFELKDNTVVFFRSNINKNEECFADNILNKSAQEAFTWIAEKFFENIAIEEPFMKEEKHD